MKIEMFEKADEINIIALRSAAENRSIAEAEKALKVEKERIRKEAEERENARIANDVLMKLINAINTKAENGETKLFLEWAKDYTMESFGVNWSDYGKAIRHIKPILEAAGYRVDDRYSYSDSWTRKSGKWGYACIYW